MFGIFYVPDDNPQKVTTQHATNLNPLEKMITEESKVCRDSLKVLWSKFGDSEKTKFLTEHKISQPSVNEIQQQGSKPARSNNNVNAIQHSKGALQPSTNGKKLLKRKVENKVYNHEYNDQVFNHVPSNELLIKRRKQRDFYREERKKKNLKPSLSRDEREQKNKIYSNEQITKTAPRYSQSSIAVDPSRRQAHTEMHYHHEGRKNKGCLKSLNIDPSEMAGLEQKSYPHGERKNKNCFKPSTFKHSKILEREKKSSSKSSNTDHSKILEREQKSYPHGERKNKNCLKTSTFKHSQILERMNINSAKSSNIDPSEMAELEPKRKFLVHQNSEKRKNKIKSSSKSSNTDHSEMAGLEPKSYREERKKKNLKPSLSRDEREQKNKIHNPEQESKTASKYSRSDEELSSTKTPTETNEQNGDEVIDDNYFTTTRKQSTKRSKFLTLNAHGEVECPLDNLNLNTSLSWNNMFGMGAKREMCTHCRVPVKKSDSRAIFFHKECYKKRLDKLYKTNMFEAEASRNSQGKQRKNKTEKKYKYTGGSTKQRSIRNVFKS